MELKIYNKTGNLILTASPNSSSSLTEEIGGECCVSVSFTHTSFVLLDVDNYIEVLGIRYKIKRQYRPKQKNTQTYEYSVKFYAPIHDAEDVLMLFSEGDTTSEFNYDGGPREHLQLWVDNMNRLTGKDVWSIGTVISAENKNIEYKNLNCWDAAYSSNGIAATFETEMWADGFVINLCKASHGERQELGYMQGLTNLSQEDNGEVKFFTRLFPLGSTRNIDASKYGYSRLQLPSRAKYVDKNVDLYGVKEETEEAAFSAIYPKYVGTISSVRTEEKENEEGRKYTVYYFKDNSMSFNPDDYQIPEHTYMLEFQTGELAGRGTDGSFQAAWHENTKEWEITNVYPDDTTQIPGEVIIPKPGDQYIPWNFSLPQEYITAAEQAYELAVNNFLSNYSFDPAKYTGTTDRNYVERNNTPLRIGQNVRLLSDNYFTNGYKDTRIIKVQRKLNDLCQATITCSDEVGTGWKSSVDNRLNNLQYVLSKQEQQAIIDIIKTTDSKSPSDYNVFSALRSLTTFLRKNQPDSTQYLLSLLGGAIFGKDGFASGLTGFGAKIDDRGYGEMRGLTLWEWLQVPELRFNRVDVYLGIKWRTPGGGIIEICTPDQDSEGNELTTGTCTLKLEEGELGAVSLDDIALGIYHFGNEKDATEDSDDGQGNFSFAGFATSYFRITEVIGNDHKEFRYSLRPGYTIHPQPQMHISCYGNFTNEDRQKSVYETREYTRMLWKQNTWTFGLQNIAMQFGDLSNLNVFGLNMSGYSMYLNSVYFTGIVSQVKPDGTPVMTANDRGAWQNDTKYEYYDRVSHNGSIWLCVNENSTNTEPSESNPNWLLQVSKGEAGQDGTSFKILGSKNNESELPQSGNDVGDAYLINGDLWVWTAENIWKNVGNIQGPAGESVKPMGNWYSGMTVPYLGVIRMGSATFMCTNQEGTTNPPMWIWTDKDTNRFIYSDNGYVLTGDINSADYVIIAEDGTDAVKIIKVDVEYAITTSNTVAPTSGWQTLAPQWENGKYIWSRSVTYYSDGNKTVTEAACISGGKGIKRIVEYYYRSTSATELIGGEWSTTCPEWINGTYIWTKSVIEYTDGTTDEEGEVNSTGAQGEGFTNLGKWYTGLLVPKMGVVTMGGSSWTAKEATRNPPLWCWTDKDGNRFTYSDGYYSLTGEQNNSEYDLLAEKGDTGEDGKDGTDGEDGKDGKDGKGYEYIFKRTTTYSQPSTPTTSQTDDYVPSGWTDDPQGVSMTYLYEWVSQRTKTNGTWSSFSTPSIWAKYGETGKTGETGALARYRGVYNSSDTYIYDYENNVLVRDIVVYNGQAYQVKTRGDSVTGVTPSSTSSRWEQGSKFSFVATDTALIDNANVAGFIFRNLGFGSDGTPYGELRSQNTDSAGSPTLYMNTKTGYFYCSNATIQGALKAGSVGDFTINKGISNVEDNPEAFIEIEKNGGKYFRVNKGTEDAMCSVRADSAKAVKIQTYGSSSSSIGLDISANSSGYGYAIRSYGNVLLNARQSEHVELYGLAINVRKVSSSGSLYSNDDFIEFANASAITFNMSTNAVKGKVVYMKKVSKGADVTLTGSFRNPGDVGISTNRKIEDEVSRMFIYDGTYWVMFYCG